MPVAERANAVSPSPATSTAYPARSSVRWARRACPGSSSRIRIRMRGPADMVSLSQREFYNGQKQAELSHRLRKLRVFHRFRQVDVTPELVAALDFIRLLGRGQDDDRNVPSALVGLETREHLIPVKPGQVQIEQQEQWQGMRGARVRVLLEEIIDRLLAIAERDDVVRDVGATQVALDQARMTRIVFDQQDRHRLLSRH